MKKINTLFVRDKANPKIVTREVSPGCEWVINGEGVATRKWDGTSCAVIGGVLYKRREYKRMSDAPPEYIPSDPTCDISKHFGWLPVSDADPSDVWHRKAWEFHGGNLPDGTYELIGEGCQGNVEKCPTQLKRHGDVELSDFPRDWDGIKAALTEGGMEGVVWHHPDGRMVKTKAKDYGVGRGKKRQPVTAQRWTDETTIKRLHIEDGCFEMDLTPPPEMLAAVAMGLAETMQAMGADNWVTFTVHHPDLGPLDMTLQRRQGETPSDQLTAAKAWITRAKAAINAAMADMEWDVIPAAECGETWPYVAEFQRLVGHPLADKDESQ